MTAHVDALAAAGIGAGLAAAQQPGELPAAVKLEKPKPYSGQMADPAVLDAFIYACELYFQLGHVTLDTYQATLALLWLEGDAAVWWQTVRAAHPVGSLTWSELKALLQH